MLVKIGCVRQYNILSECFYSYLGLQPEAKYEITVQAVNERGRSDFQQKATSATTKGMYM